MWPEECVTFHHPMLTGIAECYTHIPSGEFILRSSWMPEADWEQDKRKFFQRHANLPIFDERTHAEIGNTSAGVVDTSAGKE